MTNLFKKINFKKLGFFSFLTFLIFTPILIKIRVAEDVYVEPLAPLLGLGFLLIILSQKREVDGWWKTIKRIVLPNRLSVLYFLLIGVLYASFIYGYTLTGIFSRD